MPHTLSDIPVCQQYISPLSKLENRVTVNNEAVGLNPTWIYLPLCTTHKEPPIQYYQMREPCYILPIFYYPPNLWVARLFLPPSKTVKRLTSEAYITRPDCSCLGNEYIGLRGKTF